MIPIRRNADPWSRLTGGAQPALECVPGETALLIVDMQYASADRDHLLAEAARAGGTSAELSYRINRTEEIVPRIRRLQSACREARIEVIFVRIAGLTHDGRDHPRQPRPHYSSREAQILDAIAPVGDEIVLNKTTSSPFTSTHIDHLLRSMGIRSLLICGVATSGCVELTARDANDRGYQVVVVGDCCAGNDEQSERCALEALDRRRLSVRSLEEIIRRIATTGGRSSASSSAGDGQVSMTTSPSSTVTR